MKTRILIASLMCLPALAFFQNCSEVSFDTANASKLVAKSDAEIGLDLSEGEEGVVPPVVPPVEEGAVVPPVVPPVEEGAVPPVVEAPINNNPGNGNGKDNAPVAAPGNGKGKAPVAVEGNGNDGLNYICILKGPGKSVKLHLESEALASGISTINAVCTSRSACLNIVSQAFEVKSAERRGFCGRNPHTVTLTGADIMVLLGL